MGILFHKEFASYYDEETEFQKGERNNPVQEASTSFKYSLEESEQYDDMTIIPEVLEELKRAHKVSNQIPTAIKRYEAEAYTMFGVAYENCSQVQMAIKYFEKALEIATQQDKLNETNSCMRLGQAHINSNQIQTAIEYYERALKIAKEIEDKRNELDAYIGLGRAHEESN